MTRKQRTIPAEYMTHSHERNRVTLYNTINMHKKSKLQSGLLNKIIVDNFN